MKRLAIAGVAWALASLPLHAEPISNPVAVFAGLDKIMGQTINFEAKIGEEKKFGSLIVKADVCHTRPITEDPKTVAFVEVDELLTDGSRKRIFTGWMFAESPGLNAVEHPLYDVWLTGCRDPNAPPPPVESAPDLSTLQDQIENGDQPPPD
ncbi:MAG: DUF2155 domain-containing protein [Alphaproteobacteria bacterium]|nr:DUF2155 domain-containing protein [Alphaproteobacteria bacterium]